MKQFMMLGRPGMILTNWQLGRKSIPHTCKIGKLLFGPHNHIQSGARSRSYIDGFLMWNTSWKIGERIWSVGWSTLVNEFSRSSKFRDFSQWKSSKMWRSDRKLIEFFAVRLQDWHFSSVCVHSNKCYPLTKESIYALCVLQLQKCHMLLQLQLKKRTPSRRYLML